MNEYTSHQIAAFNLPKCLECNNEIVYYDTKVSKGKIKGKSAKTVKTTGHTLKVCEGCLSKKFPDYQTKNKGRVFNLMNEITKYAFQIEDEIYEKKRLSFIKNTVETFKEKYGNNWEEKWGAYCKKQAHSNSFEYKHEKYGLNKEEFDEYNKSRAVTKRNLIKKYGNEEGLMRFDLYKQKQKKTKSFEYMVEKFGYEKAKFINQSKAITLTNFIKRYGETLGTTKYEQYLNKHKNYHSKVATEFFTKLDILFGGYTTYHAGNKKEYGINLGQKYVFLDYYILELNVCVEFNGDLFHANPIFYDSDDIVPILNVSAKEVWEKDNKRIKKLNESRCIQTITVWQNEYTRDKKNYDFNLLKERILNASRISRNIIM
jgi:hypothetical protein